LIFIAAESSKREVISPPNYKIHFTKLQVNAVSINRPLGEIDCIGMTSVLSLYINILLTHLMRMIIIYFPADDDSSSMLIA